MNDEPRKHYVIPTEGENIVIQVVLTHEGVIIDAFQGGESLGTWAHTAHELLEVLT